MRHAVFFTIARDAKIQAWIAQLRCTTDRTAMQGVIGAA